MRFLNFTTNSPDFRIEGKNFVWTVSNQIFDEQTQEIALSSCLIQFTDMRWKQNLMVLSCSLVDENYLNYNGTIAAGVTDNKFFAFQSNVLEFWRLDCSRPRKVIFALQGVSAEKIKFANITLALN